MIPGSAIVVLLVIVSLLIILIRRNSRRWLIPTESFPAEWRTILTREISFYNSLSGDEKSSFEYKVQEFLLNCRITGIETSLNAEDKLLVASSAVIPIFEFEGWRYTDLQEVLLYPSMFNEKFDTQGPDRNITGMVGSGYMEGKMILSKPALKHGFKNESDKKNTAIHEFVHLIDKIDGSIDGIPSLLLEKQYSIPWIDLINQKIDEIFEGQSDINPYGGTNRAEFFSVVSEYFFERPKLLEKNHPGLYELLERIFKQDMASRNLSNKTKKIGRNSPCPCHSGSKFKNCCGRIHYR
jgi:Mlc titration factor MtfA (ptsG expression regulator)